jgi:hypothetical protein
MRVTLRDGLIAATIVAGVVGLAFLKYPEPFEPTAACVSNERQLMEAIISYSEDADERLPQGATSLAIEK